MMQYLVLHENVHKINGFSVKSGQGGVVRDSSNKIALDVNC